MSVAHTAFPCAAMDALFVGEKGAAFRRTSFGRKWRRARALLGLADDFRFYDPSSHRTHAFDPLRRHAQGHDGARHGARRTCEAPRGEAGRVLRIIVVR